MNPKVKAGLSVFAGMLAGAAVIAITQAMMSKVAPMPADIDMNNMEMVNQYMRTLGADKFLMVLAGYFLGAIVSGFVTNMVARGTIYRPALVTGFGLLVFGIMNMLQLWHPTWFWVVSSIGFMLGAYVGGKMVK